MTMDSHVLQQDGPAAPAAPGDDVLHAILERVREVLEVTDSDDELLDDLRLVSQITFQNVDFGLNSEWPSLPRSRIVAMFRHPLTERGDVPGDARFYVVPGAPLSGARDHLCYTLNLMTGNSAREVMTRARFVEDVADEFVELLDPDDDEEEEEASCDAEDCKNPPTKVCACEICTREIPFAVCDEAEHLKEVGQAHLEERKRAPIWQKAPADG